MDPVLDLLKSGWSALSGFAGSSHSVTELCIYLGLLFAGWKGVKFGSKKALGMAFNGIGKLSAGTVVFLASSGIITAGMTAAGYGIGSSLSHNPTWHMGGDVIGGLISGGVASIACSLWGAHAYAVREIAKREGRA